MQSEKWVELEYKILNIKRLISVRYRADMSIPEPENSPLSFHDFPSLEIEGIGPLDLIFKERRNIK